MEQMTITLLAGAAGGLIKSLEAISDLKKISEISYIKVVRNAVFGAVGGLVATEWLAVKGLTQIVLAGYFGEKIIRSAIQIFDSVLTAETKKKLPKALT